MKRISLAILCAILCRPVLVAAEPLAVQLSLSPSSTLPALPVAVRVSVQNASAAPVKVLGGMTVTVTGASSGPASVPVSLPAIWTPELTSPGTAITLAPGVTLEAIAPIEESFSENQMFLVESLSLWKPGTYQVTVTVSTADGRSVTSDPVPVTAPGGDDGTIWQELSHGGQVPFGSFSLIDRFDTLARYPGSAYYRHVAPFSLNDRDEDIDRYATNLSLAVQGLPGAYVDGARLMIARRYSGRAQSESGRNLQISAGEWSAKGRVYAQQLIDSPALPFGAITGKAVKPELRTAEAWQADYARSHTGRDGWTEPPPSAMTLAVTMSLPSPQEAGMPITVTAEASNGQPPFEYEFHYRHTPDGDWVTAREWSTSPAWTWTGAVGTFEIKALARTTGQAAAGATKTIPMQWVHGRS